MRAPCATAVGMDRRRSIARIWQGLASRAMLAAATSASLRYLFPDAHPPDRRALGSQHPAAHRRALSTPAKRVRGYRGGAMELNGRPS